MAEFRTKLITLAGIATMFAGLAQAQLSTCTVQPVAAGFVAAEGTTEQVADLTLSCTASTTASLLTLQVFLSPAVTITSATVNNGNNAFSEAQAGVTSSFATSVQGKVGGNATPANTVQAGTITGSSVTFSGIVIPINAGPTSITITNIKINASQVASSGGAPTAVTETVFASGTNIVPGPASQNPVNVAFVANGLAGVSTSNLANNGGAGSIAICTGSDAWAASSKANGFNVYFSEGFPTAFKTAGTAAANNTLGSEFATNTYTGYGVITGGAPLNNNANSGSIVQITYNNVPAGVTLYTPLVIANNGGAMSLVNGATGNVQVINTGATNNGAPGDPDGKSGGDGTYAAVTLTNGTGTVYYMETTNIPAVVEAYTVPTRITAGAAVVTAPSTSNISVTVSFAPVGATTTPNFVVGSSTPAKAPTGNSFGACTTTMLFPFVTNQLGFDTGIAISNTSMDNLKGGKAQAAAQSGTCSLTFYGSTPPAAVTTPTVAAGTSYAAAASTLAPGFQGYMFAQCNFLYGHGFAYVVYNLTQNNGAAMGYLADVLPSDRSSPVPNVSAKATFNLVGGGLSALSVSSSNASVGNTSPESWGH